MAIIACPECGDKVSDTAKTCPHCGYSLTPVATATPPPPPPAPSMQAREVGGLKAANLVCPLCGNPLEAKDVMSSGWAHCPVCDKDVMLSGTTTSFSDGIIEKIYPFGSSKEAFHKLCMKKLMAEGEEDVFSKISNIEIKQKYIWVREFGSGKEREVYPMDGYGKDFFQSITGSDVLPASKYEEWWPLSGMQSFNSEMIRGKEVVPKELSVSECKHRYMTSNSTHNYAPTDHYYCFPVYEETYEYGGKKYCFKGVGNDAISWYCWDDMPRSAFLNSKPKYTNMAPITTTVMIIAFILALLIVIGIFVENGFWLGILFTILTAIVLYLPVVFCGGILLAFTAGIDTLICKSINSGRRKTFRNKYGQIQKRKQGEAKSVMGLDLTYEVPQFPIP